MRTPSPEFAFCSQKKHRLFRLFFLCALGAIIATVVLLACVPPISRDALTHHLYIPKLYIEHGGIYEIPRLSYSYYPMNLEMLYLVPLFFGNDITPKYIHFLFAIGTAWLIWRYLKKRIDGNYAVLGAIFFLTIPIVVKLSITAYVDLGLVFFSTASLMYVFKWAEQPLQKKYLLISAASCGLMLGTKYNGLIAFFLMTLFVPTLYLRSATDRSGFKPISYAALFAIVALFVFSPWMVRNFVWTGNPLYPLYDQVFNPGSSHTAGGPSHFTIRHINYDESWWQMALIPFRIFFQGEDGNPKYFDGSLNPLLFFLPLLAFFKKEPGRIFEIEKKMMGAFSVFFILFAFFQRDMRVRYIAPVIPPLVILSIYGVHHLKRKLDTLPNSSFRRFVCGFMLLLGGFLFSSNIIYMVEQFQYVKPIAYLSGELKREAYIEQYRHEYPAMRFANNNLPESATILGLFLGNRGYYSDREILFDEEILGKSLSMYDSPERILEALYGNGVSHLIIRHDLFARWINDNFEVQVINTFEAFIKKCTRVLFSENGYTLLALSSTQL